MALPCLMYLAFVGRYSNWLRTDSGILADVIYAALSIVDIIYQVEHSWESPDPIEEHLNTSWNSISLSLNILLTLMIATRLIRHSRDIRSAIGPATENELYTTVVTMLV